MKRVLFVCMGNICRSPTAEGVARHLLRAGGLLGLMEVDSAATHGYHVGDPPDPRTCDAARRRGIDLSGQRARQIQPDDFERFDLLLAMDRDNLALLQRGCPDAHRHKLGLFMGYSSGFAVDEVPDPYYSGADGFDLVLDMAEDAVRGLIASLQK